MTLARPQRIDRAAALDRFRRIRARTRALFDLLDDQVYYDRPIPLRNPVVFYEGHLPAFAVNTLLRKALGRPGIDPQLEEIFARGIDPDTEAAAVARGNPAWPSRAQVRDYAAAAEAAIESAIDAEVLEVPGHPLLDRGQALWTILEHEEMHQETLAYMWHEVPYDRKRAPIDPPSATHDSQQPDRSIVEAGSWELGVDQARVPAGVARLGTDLNGQVFAWDNELSPHDAFVPAFAIDVHNVTNAQFMAFVEAGGYEDRRWWRADDWSWLRETGVRHPHFWERVDGLWYWRGMFARLPLPRSWPVYVTWAEAHAYARWRGMRLPTEAEFHRAACGVPSPPPANIDFERWDPEPVGARPGAVSDFGVHDLVGNGWEWTATVFAPYPGFVPLASYPEYSADFFDNDHFVLKGGSPVTARALTRPGFRNWFRPRYPYVYASFRCVQSA